MALVLMTAQLLLDVGGGLGHTRSGLLLLLAERTTILGRGAKTIPPSQPLVNYCCLFLSSPLHILLHIPCWQTSSQVRPTSRRFDHSRSSTPSPPRKASATSAIP